MRNNVKNIVRSLILNIILGHGFFSYTQAQGLNFFLEKGMEHNPALQSQKANFDASQEKIKETGSFDDPILNIGVFPDPMMRYMGEQIGEISIMQMLPWFGTRKAAKNEADYMSKMSKESWREAELNLQFRIKSAYWDLYYLQEEHALLSQEISLLKDLEKLALKKYATSTGVPSLGTGKERNNVKENPSMGSNMSMGGAGGASNSGSSNSSAEGGMSAMSGGAEASNSIVEILSIQIAAKELETQSAINLRKRKVAMKNLFVLIGESDLDSLVVSEEKTLLGMETIKQKYVDPNLQSHPMVAMNIWEQKAKEQEIEMVRNMGKPMIGIGLNYMVFRPRMLAPNEMLMENGSNMIMPMLSVSLPIYRSKTNARVQQADIMRRSAHFKEIDAQNELEMVVRDQWNALENLYDNHQILSKKVDLTHLTLRLLQTKLAVGQASFEELIEKRQNLIDYQLQFIRQIVEERKIVATLDLVYGIYSF